MTSQVNPSTIDGTFPIAGQDNDSQGFRDNFTNIKNNLTTIFNEITGIQNDAASPMHLAAQIVTPLTGTTVVVSSDSAVLIVKPAGTIAALTITMPTNPVDGQLVVLTFTDAVTSLTINGGTVLNALTTATADTSRQWIFNTASATWYKIA